MVLSRDFCEYAVHAPASRRLIAMFAQSLSSAELFFQVCGCVCVRRWVDGWGGVGVWVWVCANCLFYALCFPDTSVDFRGNALHLGRRQQCQAPLPLLVSTIKDRTQREVQPHSPNAFFTPTHSHTVMQPIPCGKTVKMYSLTSKRPVCLPCHSQTDSDRAQPVQPHAGSGLAPLQLLGD